MACASFTSTAVVIIYRAEEYRAIDRQRDDPQIIRDTKPHRSFVPNANGATWIEHVTSSVLSSFTQGSPDPRRSDEPIGPRCEELLNQSVSSIYSTRK